MRVSELSDHHPSQCLFVNAIRNQYAGWNWYYDYEYICYNKSGVKLLEHRLVAALAWGDLPDDWHVHHVDENRVNNDAVNLEPLTASEHARTHKSVNHVTLTCPICATAFDTTEYRRDVRNHTYCSDKCAKLAQRKVKRPSRERLWQLLNDVGNWLELGRMFGVSDNAVRKWAKAYELDLSVCDGRRK